MRRPHRRLHLVLWLLIAPIIGAGIFLALRHAPAEPIAEIDGSLIGNEDE